MIIDDVGMIHASRHQLLAPSTWVAAYRP